MNGFISTSCYSCSFRLSISSSTCRLGNSNVYSYGVCVCDLDSWELFFGADQSKIVLKLPTTHTHRETRFKIYAFN